VFSIRGECWARKTNAAPTARSTIAAIAAMFRIRGFLGVFMDFRCMDEMARDMDARAVLFVPNRKLFLGRSGKL